MAHPLALGFLIILPYGYSKTHTEFIRLYPKLLAAALGFSASLMFKGGVGDYPILVLKPATT